MFVKSSKGFPVRDHFSKVLLPLKCIMQLLQFQFLRNTDCFIWVGIQLDVNLDILYLILLGYCERMMFDKCKMRDAVLIFFFLFLADFQCFVMYWVDIILVLPVQEPRVEPCVGGQLPQSTYGPVLVQAASPASFLRPGFF